MGSKTLNNAVLTALNRLCVFCCVDASVSISTSWNTKEKRHVMTFKDKAKWFSFEMSFVLAQSYAYACAYAVLMLVLTLHTSLDLFV